jgi:hypothetical protein
MGWCKNGVASRTEKLRQLSRNLQTVQRKLAMCAEQAAERGWSSDNELHALARRVGIFRLAVDSIADEHRDPRGRFQVGKS